MPRKRDVQKKPSKALTAKISAYNKLNEKNNRELASKRAVILKQAKKEGFVVSVK